MKTMVKSHSDLEFTEFVKKKKAWFDEDLIEFTASYSPPPASENAEKAEHPSALTRSPHVPAGHATPSPARFCRELQHGSHGRSGESAGESGDDGDGFLPWEIHGFLMIMSGRLMVRLMMTNLDLLGLIWINMGSEAEMNGGMVVK